MYSRLYICIVALAISYNISMIVRGDVVLGIALILCHVPWSIMAYDYHKNKKQ